MVDRVAPTEIDQDKVYLFEGKMRNVPPREILTTQLIMRMTNGAQFPAELKVTKRKYEGEKSRYAMTIENISERRMLEQKSKFFKEIMLDLDE